MSTTFAHLTFTPAVLRAQQQHGGGALLGRGGDADDRMPSVEFGPNERDFIARQRSFYMATVSETGWPYVQHRGGAPGFLKVIDGQTLAFDDLTGNRQFISVGNLAANDRMALILVDYTRRQRLKLLGRLAVDAPQAEPAVTPAIRSARVRTRRMSITVEAFDWNCPQHIPRRFEAEDVEAALQARDRRIAELEAALASFPAASASRLT